METRGAARVISMFVSMHVCVNMCGMETGPARGFSRVAAVLRNRCKLKNKLPTVRAHLTLTPTFVAAMSSFPSESGPASLPVLCCFLIKILE